MSMEKLATAEALAFLSQPRTVAICGHVNPDGDSLGSALALAALLRAKGSTVTTLLAQDSRPPELYEFLTGYDFVPAALYRDTPELFIAVDLPNPERLGDALAVFERAGDTFAIDHHPDYTGFCHHYYGTTEAAATGLLIWELIRESGIEISREIAEYCYVALVTDTGRFSFQNTTARSLTAAGEMVMAGVDPAGMNMKIYDSRSLAALMLDARLISRITFSSDKCVVYSWVTEEDFKELGLSRDETEGLPTILRSVREADVAILLREESGQVRVNLRAKTGKDVGEFARRFNGGGHKAAAGFTLKMTLDEARALILGKAENLLCCKGS
ncbi:MAG: bifunctional oligoribonuclease/PAP phosphatase NrnA [Coriobacteriales bacterium]|jgi:phosphoesterase RecJ-like protein|nr:bifunctional oligoribonuclease/PAP phosphatase NrnA [Coriobacteriales bacterium]